jgi:hypothetical protein
MSKVRETQEGYARFVASIPRWPSANVPPWVPAAARNYLLGIEEVKRPKLPDDKEPPRELVIAQRLVSEPKMRSAWRVLGKLGEQALTEFLDSACSGIPIHGATIAERDKTVRSFSDVATVCRNLIEFNHYFTPDDAKALARVADIFDGHARVLEEMDSRRFVKNRTKDDEARAYVRMIGGVTRRISGGRVLYKTVATVATIALQRPVDWQQVRKWCASAESSRHTK